MELREFVWLSLKVILLCQIISLSIQPAECQLDLPGPPYPDLQGRNRWGVKFDPRKPRGPRDQRGGSSSHPYRRPRHRRPFRRPKESDSFWSPARLRPHQSRRHKQRPSRFYGNEINPKRPQSYLKAYENDEPVSPITLEEQKFWKTWNSWSKKQAKPKEVKSHGSSGSGKSKEPETTTPITIYIDMDDMEDLKLAQGGSQDEGDDSYGNHKHKHGKDCPESRWKKSRDYYLSRMKDVYSRAKSLVTFESSETDDDEAVVHKPKKEGGWQMFTTIGKGLDAANGAMRSVRKTVGGSVIATGMKYGGKMAVDAVMNVGTSALTTAIKTATFG